MNTLLGAVETFFASAERKIALIDRCRPLNWSSQMRELGEAWARGAPQNPRWVYAPAPDLGEVRDKLESIGAALEDGDELAGLYAERAREICLEAELAEAVGRPGFRLLANRRYGHPLDAGVSYTRAKVWASLEAGPLGQPRYLSHDATEPVSLLSLMLQSVRELDLPFGVVVRDDLSSAAAISEDLILVQAELELNEREARRIVVHELYGHALPRTRARREPLGLFRVGSARGSDEEEGRALLMERRHGLFSIERQIELGRRHLAAWAVARGADWVETVRQLTLVAAPIDIAMSVASRAHRGGGLGRERVYLSALESVEQALKGDAELESWLERGRLSVAAARVLRGLGAVSSQSASVAPARSALELYE